MHTTKHSFWLAPLVTLAACTVPGPVDLDSDEAESRVELPASAQRELQQTLDGVVAQGVAPGAIITVHHPAYRRFSAAAGVADRATGERLTPSHRLRAGSMLKMGVAAAVLQLVERRRLSLDAPLTRLVAPALAARVAEAGHITLRMLLEHTAGVPEFADGDFEALVLADPTRVWAIDEFLARSAGLPRPFPPGGGWAYSNTHYVLLGAVLEAVTGEPWRETVEARVFERAGLANTSLPSPGNPRCRGCARGYELVGSELLDLTEVDPSMADASGGGALVTTTDDLVRFLRALAAGQLFDHPATLASMQSFVAAPSPVEAQTGYGLGLARFQVGDTELIGHLGGTAGFQGFVLRDPSTGVTVAGVMTTRGDFGAFILPVLDAAARIP